MIILFIYCVYKGLNCIRNILLYDLLIDLNTRVKEYDVEDLRLYNLCL